MPYNFFSCFVRVPPKGDSPDPSCHFKCCFLFAVFTVFPLLLPKRNSGSIEEETAKNTQEEKAHSQTKRFTRNDCENVNLFALRFGVFFWGFVSSFKNFRYYPTACGYDSFACHLLLLFFYFFRLNFGAKQSGVLLVLLALSRPCFISVGAFNAVAFAR